MGSTTTYPLSGPGIGSNSGDDGGLGFFDLKNENISLFCVQKKQLAIETKEKNRCDVLYWPGFCPLRRRFFFSLLLFRWQHNTNNGAQQLNAVAAECMNRKKKNDSSANAQYVLL